MAGTQASVTAGERWRLAVDVTTDDAAAPTYTVTGAGTAGGTMTLVDGSSCQYEAFITTSGVGWYMAEVSLGDDVLNMACYANRVVAPGERPTVDDVLSYLAGESSWTEDEVADTLAAEDADQRARCRVAPVYPPSLFYALQRRAARALAMRAVLLGLQDSDGFVSRMPRWDAEIRRYEGPYKRMPVG